MKRLEQFDRENQCLYLVPPDEVCSHNWYSYVLLPNGKYLSGSPSNPAETDDIRIAAQDLMAGMRTRLDKKGLKEDEVQFVVPLGVGQDYPMHKPQFRYKCWNLDSLLAGDPALLAIAHTAAQNEILRGTILRLTGKLPPESECESFEKLNAWVNVNCSAPVSDEEIGREEVLWDEPIAPLRPAQPRTAPRPRTDVVATAEFHLWDMESGRCRYSVSRDAYPRVELTAEALREKLEEAVANETDISDVLDEIVDELRDSAEDGADLEIGENNYDYEDHESTSDGDGADSEMENRSTVEEAIRQWCRDNMNEADRVRIGL